MSLLRADDDDINGESEEENNILLSSEPTTTTTTNYFYPRQDEEEEYHDDGDDDNHHHHHQHTFLSSSKTKSSSSSSSSSYDLSLLFTPVVLSILVTETAERFAYYGFRAILVLYFIEELYLDDNTAISWFAYTTCLINFSPLLGAIVAESKNIKIIGGSRYNTILSFGTLYSMGLILLTYSAIFLNHDYDDGGTDSIYKEHGVEDSLQKLFWKRTLSVIGLIMICIGTGGIKPCVNIFGADQVALRDRNRDRANITTSTRTNNNPLKTTTTTTTKEQQQEVEEDDDDIIIGRTNDVRQFFNFFYFCINVGAVTSFALIPFVKKIFGFGSAFFLTTICMISALILFYSKRNQYVYRSSEEEESGGSSSSSSNLAKTFRICIRLIRQRLLSSFRQATSTVTTTTTTNNNNNNNNTNNRTRGGGGAGGGHRRHHHRHQLIPQNSGELELQEEDQVEVLVERTSETHIEHDFTDEPLSLQVHSVRNTKAIHTTTWGQHQLALEDAHQALQILPVFLMLPMFWMLYDQQGSVWTLQASRMKLHGLEPEQLSVLNPLEIMVFLPLFDRFIYPEMEARQIDIAPLRRMGWGMILASLSFVVSGLLEQVIERALQDSVSVFWMIPQITILAVGEILLSVTGLEYAYSRSPDRLKGFIMATYLLMGACGDLLGGILYSSVFRHMDRAVAMFVCASLMLANRFVFGRVVKATNQDTTTSLNVGGGSDALHGPSIPEETNSTDVSETNRDNPGKDPGASIETIQSGKAKEHNHQQEEQQQDEQRLIAAESNAAESAYRDIQVGEEDWLSVEMSNLRVV